MFDIVSTRYHKISWRAGMMVVESTNIVIMQLILPAVCLLTSTHTLLFMSLYGLEELWIIDIIRSLLLCI